MKIIIVGCGKIGGELAGLLSREDNDVMVIDKNEAVVQECCDRYDIMGTVGNGASYDVLMEAEIAQADLVIAVTGSDELNLLCCLVARKVGKNVHTIARLRNPDYTTQIPLLKEELGLAMVISQEQTVAREIARIMKFPSAIEIDTFAKGRVELLRFRIPTGSVLDGMNLIEMHTKLKADVLVCTVERGGSIVIPNGEYRLQAQDVISIVSEANAEEAFFKQIGLQTNKVKNVIIVGGGDVSFYLAKQLSEYGIRTKVIERDLKRCEQLSELLPKVTIIHGDGSDRALLMEEGLDRTEGFAALTNIDEENVILSLYAKRNQVRKIVTKINRIDFEDVISELELDTTVHPKNLTAEYILQYVRARKNSLDSNVEALHWIMNHKAEALEFHIRENTKHTDIPLQDLKLKPGVLIGCINRGGTIMLPRGRDVMKKGDNVVVVTTIQGVKDFKDIFEEG